MGPPTKAIHYRVVCPSVVIQHRRRQSRIHRFQYVSSCNRRYTAIELENRFALSIPTRDIDKERSTYQVGFIRVTKLLICSEICRACLEIHISTLLPTQNEIAPIKLLLALLGSF